MIHLDVSRATLIGAAGKNVNWWNRDNASKWNDSVCLTFPERVSDDGTWRAQASNALTTIRRANISNRMRTRWRASHFL
jgi:hypothetical protein